MDYRPAKRESHHIGYGPRRRRSHRRHQRCRRPYAIDRAIRRPSHRRRLGADCHKRRRPRSARPPPSTLIVVGNDDNDREGCRIDRARRRPSAATASTTTATGRRPRGDRMLSTGRNDVHPTADAWTSTAANAVAPNPRVRLPRPRSASNITRRRTSTYRRSTR